MWLLIVAEGGIAAYAAAYLWNCVQRRRGLAAAGAMLQALLAALMGSLLIVFAV